MRNINLTFALLCFTVSIQGQVIVFEDDNVKTLCVENWDADKDGELSVDEAASVSSLGNVFRENNTIVSFNELQYFTGLVSINDYAFYRSSIHSLTFPPSVKSIGDYAFSQSRIGSELIIPGTIKKIGDFSFESCKLLNKIVLEEGVEELGWHTFSGPIETFSLPTSLTFSYSMLINPYVNSDPSSGVFIPEGDLWVFSHGVNPPSIDNFAFYYVFSDGHLVVPFGSIETYKAADAWSHFREYFEQGDVNADGYIDPEDVKLLQQVLNGEDVELKNALLADVNGDGQVDAADMDELNTHFYAEDGTPTMMAGVNAEDEMVHGGVFTMDGRRVLDDASQIHSLRPGIYIAHGRKVVVR